MLDIGISSQTGEIMAMSVPLYRAPIRRSSHVLGQTSNVIEGMPTFRLSLWNLADQSNDSADFFLVNGAFELILEEKNLSILLFPDEIQFLVGDPETFLCAFNAKNELCAIQIKNLQDSEFRNFMGFENLWKHYL